MLLLLLLQLPNPVVVETKQKIAKVFSILCRPLSLFILREKTSHVLPTIS